MDHVLDYKTMCHRQIKNKQTENKQHIQIHTLECVMKHIFTITLRADFNNARVIIHTAFQKEPCHFLFLR